MKDRLLYYFKRFGMLIPAAITILLHLISGSMLGGEDLNSHYEGLRIAMWTFFGITGVWLGYWVVRVIMYAVEVYKKMK